MTDETITTEEKPQDLDSLLAEYSEPAPEPAPAAQAPGELDEIRNFMAEQNRRDIASGVTEAGKSIQAAAGERASGLPVELFEGAIHREAMKDPRIEKAFSARGSNPSEWDNIVQALGQKIGSQLTPTDAQSTDSWASVESAVAGSSSASPSDDMPDISTMSDTEFQKFKQQMMRKKAG